MCLHVALLCSKEKEKKRKVKKGSWPIVWIASAIRCNGSFKQIERCSFNAKFQIQKICRNVFILILNPRKFGSKVTFQFSFLILSLKFNSFFIWKFKKGILCYKLLSQSSSNKHSNFQNHFSNQMFTRRNTINKLDHLINLLV